MTMMILIIKMIFMRYGDHQVKGDRFQEESMFKFYCGGE